MSQKITIVCLIFALALGAATNGIALTSSCAPKVCCCTTTSPENLHHDGRGLMRLTHSCAPMAQAPCCHFKPVQFKSELAISPRADISANQAAMIWRPTVDALPEAQLFATRTSILEDERIRAPLVPIYLLTLTILC